jgi:CSLREA domain-containing protein
MDDDTTVNSNCTLREAIIAANTNANVDGCIGAGTYGADTINLPAGTYPRSSAYPYITDSLTITGADAATTVIDGSSQGGVLRFEVGSLDKTAFVSDVTITGGGNTYIGGGVATVNYGTVTLRNVTVRNNSAYNGGGLYVLGNDAMVVENSTVSGNNATDYAGGGVFTNGVMTLTNVTISGNTSNYEGGGFRNAGTATLTNVTISNNNALVDSGGIKNFDGPITFKNTIVANNSGANCYTRAGSLVSAGYNLDSGTTCGFTGTVDLINTDPLLGPLQDNGGPTWTRALLDGSPAIDAVSAGCPPPATDQRGVNRPQGIDCDIGAFELAAPSDTTAPVITPNVSGTEGTNGWYVGDVTVSWDVSDPESTVISPPCGQTEIKADTAGTLVTCSATSAGGTASQSVTISRDATPPTATATASPRANANGWRKQKVTVSFSGTDATSGIASCSAPVTVATEGAYQTSSSGTCTDLAGNISVPAKASGISIDLTPPTPTINTPREGTVYNRNDIVIANFSCTDSLSEIQSCVGTLANGVPIPTNKKAKNAKFTVTATDKAGNTAKLTVNYGVN